MKKQPYLSPQIEVVVMENEGVIAGSLDGITDGGWATQSLSSHTAQNCNRASSGGLENLTNGTLIV